MKNLFLVLIAVFLCALLFTGCNVVGGSTKIAEGVVIAPKAILRSSTAKVALPVAELKRGDKLDILEQAEVKTPESKIGIKSKLPAVPASAGLKPAMSSTKPS